MGGIPADANGFAGGLLGVSLSSLQLNRREVDLEALFPARVFVGPDLLGRGKRDSTAVQMDGKQNHLSDVLPRCCTQERPCTCLQRGLLVTEPVAVKRPPSLSVDAFTFIVDSQGTTTAVGSGACQRHSRRVGMCL